MHCGFLSANFPSLECLDQTTLGVVYSGTIARILHHCVAPFRQAGHHIRSDPRIPRRASRASGRRRVGPRAHRHRAPDGSRNVLWPHRNLRPHRSERGGRSTGRSQAACTVGVDCGGLRARARPPAGRTGAGGHRVALCDAVRCGPPSPTTRWPGVPVASACAAHCRRSCRDAGGRTPAKCGGHVGRGDRPVRARNARCTYLGSLAGAGRREPNGRRYAADGCSHPPGIFVTLRPWVDG